MKTVIYLVLVLATTSCSTINYIGTAKSIKKVRVDKTHDIAQISDKVVFRDSVPKDNYCTVRQKYNPVLMKEIPTKSSKADFQQPQHQYLKEKKKNFSDQNREVRLSHKRLKPVPFIYNKASTNNQHEKNIKSKVVSGYDRLDNPILKALLIIAGILILALLITLIAQGFMYNPELTGKILAIVILTGVIVIIFLKPLF